MPSPGAVSPAPGLLLDEVVYKPEVVMTTFWAAVLPSDPFLI
jgi:hypothetical protein